MKITIQKNDKNLFAFTDLAILLAAVRIARLYSDHLDLDTDEGYLVQALLTILWESGNWIANPNRPSETK
jgi:hypothetical protein